MNSNRGLRLIPVVLTLALLLAAGCTALPPVFPAAPVSPEPARPLATLTGQVTYRERIALPPAAVIEVKLQDVSLADAPAKLIAVQTIQAAGKQVPIPYVLEYDPARIDPRMRYAVSARITENGKLTWISTTVNPVLTGGAPTDGVEIVVQPVGGG